MENVVPQMSTAAQAPCVLMSMEVSRNSRKYKITSNLMENSFLPFLTIPLPQFINRVRLNQSEGYRYIF